MSIYQVRVKYTLSWSITRFTPSEPGDPHTLPVASNGSSRLRFLLSSISIKTACPMGINIAAVAVLLSHMDRKHVVPINPSINLKTKGHVTSPALVYMYQ